MRTKDILTRGFDDIVILMRYLYLDEKHSVTVDNGFTNLTIKMNDSLYFVCTNEKFPDLPPLNYSEEMTIQNMLAIISQLKTQKPQEYTGGAFNFSSRWEEIETITKTNLGLNLK